MKIIKNRNDIDKKIDLSQYFEQLGNCENIEIEIQPLSKEREEELIFMQNSLKSWFDEEDSDYDNYPIDKIIRKS